MLAYNPTSNSSEVWTNVNPILEAGKVGLETDTGKTKLGDGNNRWTDLRYFGSVATAAPDAVVDASTTVKGIVELATNSETTTGTDDVRAVTPVGLKAALDAFQAALEVGAPGLLNSFDEIAAAINDDANIAATLIASIAGKQASSAELTTLAGITSTAYGRGFLTLADRAALQALIRQAGNAQTGSSYTLTLADENKFTTLNNASANTLIVPKNATLAIPVDAVFEGAQIGAGQTTITPEDGTVTITAAPGLKVANQGGVFGLRKLGTNTWLAYGRLAA